MNNGETWPGFGVAVVDEQGIIVTDSTATVTLTLESGSAPTGLAGTFEQNAGNQDPAGNSVPGTAVFYDIMYTTETASLPEQIVIEATAPGLIGGSVEINVANTGSGSNSAPVITSNGGGATADVNAAENQTAVTTVIATDADTGNTLTYSITGGADNSRFSVGSSSGILTFKSAPDYENPVDANTDGEFIIEVTVSDGTTTDVQTITVTVTDVNDNAPVITSNGGGATADVNAAENQTAVTTITATDADTTGTLTYSITGGADNSHFSINESFGVLTFNNAKDYENPDDANTDGEFIIEVTVSDGNNSDVQTITVTVTDGNDAPVITSNGGGATADVNAAENQTAVTTVIVSDPDVPAQTMTYSITGGADNSHFSINSSLGVVTFNSAPDYENPVDANTDGEFIIEVTVSDGTTTDVQTITVTVTDVNDNAPVITSNGGGATADVNAAENQTAVTTITATDADTTGTLTYSITGGADNSHFSINESFGVLTFNNAKDYENPDDANTDGDFIVEVTVSDGITTDVQTITVTVTDVVGY